MTVEETEEGALHVQQRLESAPWPARGALHA